MDDRRLLVVSAHPDDIEYGCAGSVARMVDEGWHAAYVIVTSGQKGTQDPHSDPEEFGAVREEESRQAALICGVEDVTFLRYMDSELAGADYTALLRDLSREFRRQRPHRVIAMEADLVPNDRFVNHPDHRVTGTATLDITVSGGSTGGIFPELTLEEGLPAWRDLEEVWLFGPIGGPLVVDVTTTLDRRMEALRAHASQMGDQDPVPFVTEYLRRAGERHGVGYAETFRVIHYRD